MKLHFKVDGNNFSLEGEASGKVKNVLKKLGGESGISRKIAIAMYEAEMNMVIHADGGVVGMNILPEKIEVF